MAINRFPKSTTVSGFYTGQIETVSDKVYTVDPSTDHALTITSVFAKTGSGTVAWLLKQGSSNVAVMSLSSSTGVYGSAISNASVAAGETITMTTSSNSSGTDLVFRIGYEYEVDLDE